MYAAGYDLRRFMPSGTNAKRYGQIMKQQHERTALLFGDKITRLYQCRVAVFGIGGVGGAVAEALARSGVGQLDLIDAGTQYVGTIIQYPDKMGVLTAELIEKTLIGGETVEQKQPMSAGVYCADGALSGEEIMGK